MTTRIEKQLQRLESLEQEYAKLVEAELEKATDGKHSTYLVRKIPHIWDGKSYRDAATAHIECLEKEITLLRNKLGEPFKFSPVGVVMQFSEKREVEKDWHAGGSVREAKKVLEQLRRMKK